ncbi:hypothetical protein FQN60_005772 [Etheostoma spectabile]|uniref:Uncharacterized protein n=1 Tax=Etheostoma spectabile TaxID=54343 RepID=A0A5J5CEP9_9PERO|nr:hypothetical protein FQN60_005772 [Etheostoma spectabile]
MSTAQTAQDITLHHASLNGHREVVLKCSS